MRCREDPRFAMGREGGRDAVWLVVHNTRPAKRHTLQAEAEYLKYALCSCEAIDEITAIRYLV